MFLIKKNLIVLLVTIFHSVIVFGQLIPGTARVVPKYVANGWTGGSGMVVALDQPPLDSTKALVITSGHIVDYYMESNFEIVNEPMQNYIQSIYISDGFDNRAIEVKSGTILYASKDYRDMAIIEIDMTYGQLEKKQIFAVQISSDTSLGSSYTVSSGGRLKLKAAVFSGRQGDVTEQVANSGGTEYYKDYTVEQKLTFEFTEYEEDINGFSGAPIISRNKQVIGLIYGVTEASNFSGTQFLAISTDLVNSCYDPVRRTFNVFVSSCRVHLSQDKIGYRGYQQQVPSFQASQVASVAPVLINNQIPIRAAILPFPEINPYPQGRPGGAVPAQTQQSAGSAIMPFGSQPIFPAQQLNAQSAGATYSVQSPIQLPVLRNCAQVADYNACVQDNVNTWDAYEAQRVQGQSTYVQPQQTSQSSAPVRSTPQNCSPYYRDNYSYYLTCLANNATAEENYNSAYEDWANTQ